MQVAKKFAPADGCRRGVFIGRIGEILPHVTALSRVEMCAFSTTGYSLVTS